MCVYTSVLCLCACMCVWITVPYSSNIVSMPYSQHELSQHREGISKELNQLSQQLDHSRNIQVSSMLCTLVQNYYLPLLHNCKFLLGLLFHIVANSFINYNRALFWLNWKRRRLKLLSWKASYIGRHQIQQHWWPMELQRSTRERLVLMYLLCV